ncbi:MAG: hypothetical protein ACXWBP_09055, partial [Limisphaerales bacterium]
METDTQTPPPRKTTIWQSDIAFFAVLNIFRLGSCGVFTLGVLARQGGHTRDCMIAAIAGYFAFTLAAEITLFVSTPAGLDFEAYRDRW